MSMSATGLHARIVRTEEKKSKRQPAAARGLADVRAACNAALKGRGLNAGTLLRPETRQPVG